LGVLGFEGFDSQGKATDATQRFPSRHEGQFSSHKLHHSAISRATNRIAGVGGSSIFYTGGNVGL